jgi:prepilin-type processing-associated H-X9-DG protein
MAGQGQQAGGWWGGITPFRLSYGYNNNLSQVNQAAITSVATTVLLTDTGGIPDPSKPSHDWVNEPAGFIIDDTTTAEVSAGSANNDHHYTAPIARHLEMCNVLWADGHVKAMKWKSSTTPTPTPCPTACASIRVWMQTPASSSTISLTLI